jgi:methyl-accepting chemotaxis protein
MMSMKQVQFFVLSVMVLTLIGLAAISVIGYQGTDQIHGTYDEIVHSEIPKLELLQRMTYESSTVQRKILFLVIASSNNDLEGKESAHKAIEEARQKSTKYFQEMESLIQTEEAKKILKEIKNAESDYHEKGDRLVELALEGKTADAFAYNKSATLPAFNRYQTLLEQLVEEVVGLADQKGKEADSEAKAIRNKTLTLGISIFVIGFLGVCFTVWNLRSTMRKLTLISNSIEEGSTQTATASGEVSSSSQSLAHGASEQASSLEETSASLEEMSSMTKRNAENAREVKGLANEARHAGDKGVEEMSALKIAMTEIQASGNEISKIIKTIDEIAFQTNILALNAAVEAARAGEAGAGFSVVADEVRSLAQRSALASRETSEKIEGAIQKAKHGGELTLRVAESLSIIVDKSKKVDQLILEITSASDEQSRGVDQINIAIGQMDKVTQSSAANAEQTAAAAEELSSQAESLRGLILELNEIVGGVSTPTVAVHPPVVSHPPHDFKRNRLSLSPPPKKEFDERSLPLPPLSTSARKVSSSSEKRGDDFFKDADSFRDMN